MALEKLDEKRLFVTRSLCFESLYVFTRWMFRERRGYQWTQAKHHELICDALERVFNGETKRLIINIPPRYSKTEIAVVNFIAWAMGRVPDCEFIHASYSATLAVNNSVQIRNLVQHEAYRAIFPDVELASESSHHWKTTAGGVMYATGAGGTITGFGAGKHREGFGGCFPVWQKVVTDLGDVDFSEIQQSEKQVCALSYNEQTGLAEYQPIDTFWINPENDIYSVILSDGSVFECTANHKVLTADGYKEVIDLTEDSTLVSLSNVFDLVDGNSKHISDFSPAYTSVVDNPDFFWRVFLFMLPVGIRQVLRNALPCFTRFDLPDYAAADPESFREGCGVIGAGKYGENVITRKFCAGASFEKRECSVLNSILHIVGFATIGEILKSVVMGVSVQVSAFFADSTRADECFQDKLVNIFCDYLRLERDVHPEIPFTIFAGLEEFLRDLIRTALSVYCSRMAFHSAETTDGVDAFKPFNRKPLFVGKVAHVSKTFCLEIRNNHNFILSQSKAIVSNCIIIDDPHKADEARSEVRRQNVIDWFQNTVESRKNSPDTPIILIMQRLHEKDLAGWLLDGGNGEEWEHLCLPAIQDDGTALWPEKHDIETLRRMEQAAPYVFAGQYLQKPAPPDGGTFKPDNLQFVKALPAGNIRWVRAWDLASTANDGDYTAGGRLGVTEDGRYIIANIVRGQYGADERDRILRNTAQKDGVKTKISIPQDPGQAGKSQTLYLTRQLAGFSVSASPESGDKVTRAEPFAAQVNIGNVMVLDDGTWDTDALIAEMRMFPNGQHDDQIDCLSRAFGELLDTRTGMIDYLRSQVEANK